MSDQSHALVEVRDAVRHLELRIDARFEGVDRRFEGVDRKVETRFDTIDRRIDGLDAKISGHFVWLVSIHVTTLVAIVAALLARP